MKRSTIEKLFDGDSSKFSELASADLPGTKTHLTFISVNSQLAIVQEFHPQGFEVYVAVPGNSIDDCKKALGIS